PALLVSQDVRALPRPPARVLHVRISLSRLQPDVLPDARARFHGDAAARLHVPAGEGLGTVEPTFDDRGGPDRRRDPALLRQRRPEPPAGSAGGNEPLGRGDPRVGDGISSSRLQLRTTPGRVQPGGGDSDRKSTRLNSSHVAISY